MVHAVKAQDSSNAHAQQWKWVGLVYCKCSAAGIDNYGDMLQLVSLALLVLVLTATLSGGEARAYTNSWAVAVEGGAEAADQLAAKYGFTNLGLVTS